MTDQRLMRLRQVLAEFFSEEDLRTLCFDLGVNYDALPATGTGGKAREIILDLGKQGRLPELVAYVRQARPALAVDDLPPSIMADSPAALSALSESAASSSVTQTATGSYIAQAGSGGTATVSVTQQIEAPAPVLNLHQLPSPPRDFTGREGEMKELLTQLEQGGVTISGLWGLGGVGKTALALKLAEELTPHYPDAQFYLDLKGTTSPVFPADAMAHIVRSYYPTSKLPDDPAELQGLYYSVLHDQRALLLMDNVRDGAQVEPLIPSAGCALLVTSRWHFTLPGLYAKDLDTLPPDDAHDFLLKIAARIGDQADAMVQLCGCLPLALRLAGSVLAERKSLGVPDYVRRLQDVRKRLELVEASLSLSYDLLTPELQRRWRMLAVFPQEFDVHGVASVWEKEDEATQEAAQEALDELVRFSLVEWNETTKRYSLHDLVRLFAEAKLSEEECARAQRCHAEHYVQVADVADKLYLQGGESILRGLALFDVEWGNIQAGQAWAAAYAENDNATARLCISYPQAGWYCLELRQHSRKKIHWGETALGAARQLKDRVAEGGHLGNLGLAYATLGDSHRAIEFYEQQLVIIREIGDRRGEGAALGNLGNAYADLGDAPRAIEFGEAALRLFEAIESPNAQTMRDLLAKWRGQ